MLELEEENSGGVNPKSLVGGTVEDAGEGLTVEGVEVTVEGAGVELLRVEDQLLRVGD